MVSERLVLGYVREGGKRKPKVELESKSNKRVLGF
jgi:hypothetical protein